MTARKNIADLIGADKYIAEHVPRETYAHLVKDTCQSHGCLKKLKDGIRGYERFGNYCQECHKKARVLRLSERQLDIIFSSQSEETFYDTLQRQVAREMQQAIAQSTAEDFMVEYSK